MDITGNTMPHIQEGAQEISSTVSYLLGLNESYINKGSLRLSYFRRLQSSKSARIVRNLCILRTDIMKNYERICAQQTIERKTLLHMPKLISECAIQQLSSDGIIWYRHSNTQPEHHIVELNRLISDRINNCRDLFPLWLDWNYVRNLFIMPNGLCKAGVKEELRRYWRDSRYYPYQLYLNWIPSDCGNILYNDNKLVSVIYQQNEDKFEDSSKVRDIGGFIKDNVISFISQSKKLVLAVDCENTDPYKLCAALKSLEAQFSQKIAKIILFDDANTGPLWKAIEKFTAIPVERILVERVTKFKSLVDTTLTATVSKEHYLNDVDSFILVSSDSDYWGMISSLTSAKFLLMVERGCCGESLKTTLRDAGIFFCYLDDFYTGSVSDIKYSVLLQEIQQKLATALELNINTLMMDAIQTVRADMTEAEQRQFAEKYLRHLKLKIDVEGNVSITI